MEWWLFPMLLWEVLSTLIYVCYLLGSVSLKLLSNFRLPWPEASGSQITLGYSFCWKHTDVLKPFEMVAHFLQVAAFAPSGYWNLLIIREVLEDTIQSYLSFKQGPMESILQKQDLSLWVTFRFVLCSAFCSSSLISRRHPGAVDIKGLLIVTLVMVTRNTCPLQFEMAFPRHKNKYLVNFVLLNTKWYNSFGAIICVRLLCEYCHIKPQPLCSMTVTCIWSCHAVLWSAWSRWITAISIRERCFIRLQRGARDNWMAAKHFAVFIILRVEPALTRIKEDRKRIILPAIDNIKYNTFEVQQYANAAHGYNWGLWCMYIIPPQDWLDKGDESAPIR